MSDDQPMQCPECGEDAVRQPPQESAWWEPPGLPAPDWSHRDGTPLCPVIGPSRDCEPGKPEPADIHTMRLHPPATMRQARPVGLEIPAGRSARRSERELPAGTAGVLGRQYMAEVIARLGDTYRQALPDTEPEAGS